MTKLLVVLAVVALSVVAAPAASACSCIAPGPPRADLARSDGAFVGIYRSRYRLSASAFSYKFTIVRRVKGNLPPRTINVVAGTNSASCGLQVRKGQRVALLLQRSNRQWRSSLCDQRAANFFRGVPSRLLVFPDEGHWVLQPVNSLRWYQEVLGWIDRWAKGGKK